MPRKRKGGARKGGTPLGMVRIPQFRPTPHLNHKFRWTAAATSTAGSVTGTDMLRWYVVASGTTTTALLIGALRLKRVTLWSAYPAAGAVPQSVSIEWNGDNAPSQVYSDQSTGINPAFVSQKPPARSSNRWWYTQGGTNLADNIMTLSYGIGSTIEIDTEVFLVDTEAATAGPTTSGLTAGRVYGGGLVGNATNTVPVGLTPLP